MFIGKINAGVFFSTAATVVLFAQYSLCNVILTTPKVTTNANSTEIVSTEEIRKHYDDLEEYEDYSGSHSSEESAEERLNQKILDFAISEINAFCKKSLNSFRMPFESVSQEIIAYNSANRAALQSGSGIFFFVEFLELWKELEELENENDIDYFRLLVDMTTALEEYNATLTSDSSNEEDKFINQLLQKYRYKHMTRALEEYNATLTSDSSNEEVKFIKQLLQKYNFASVLSELHTNAKHFMKTFKSSIHKLAVEGNVRNLSEGDFEESYKDLVDFIGIYDNTLFGERE